ncbi:MAG: hypothetical protein K2O42_03940 [Oscillospiraceae bacterium]|nr:hypothetical protein [Oscillospiraceae bacterium]
MAFVYSVLLEEEKKELVNKYKFNDYFKRNRTAELYNQVYDEQQNMRLLPVVRGGINGKRNKPGKMPYHWEIPIIFAFIWNEKICKIEIYYERKKVNEKRFCYLEIPRIVAPEFFRDRGKELIFFIKEALKKEERFLMWSCEIVFPETIPVQFTDNKGWNYES